MIHIDGSLYEGGGQIVRSALALSTITGRAVRITNIRAGRPKPGLKAQHLKCIEALTALCNATTHGASLSSTTLEYIPGKLKAKNFTIDMHTAGSVTLLLQSILIPLSFTDKASTITLIGGTNGKWAMPAEYVQHVLIPYIQPFFERIEVIVQRRGYYPIGGGELILKTKPHHNVLERLTPLNYRQRGPVQVVKGIAHASAALASRNVSERAKQRTEQLLKEYTTDISIEYAKTSSTGMGITLWAVCSDDEETMPPCHIGADALGEMKTSAERVAEIAVQQLLEELRSGAPVDVHVADNLIPFLALAGGTIRTSAISNHTRANMYVCEKLLDTTFTLEQNTISTTLKPSRQA